MTRDFSRTWQLEGHWSTPEASATPRIIGSLARAWDGDIMILARAQSLEVASTAFRPGNNQSAGQRSRPNAGGCEFSRALQGHNRHK